MKSVMLCLNTITFQGQYERSIAAYSRVLDENRYAIAIGSFHGALKFEEERIVIADPLNQTATCSCQMFNRTRILCAHGLKVLDLMNIKTLPTHYVLKRWTREARNGSIQDRQGRNVVENPKLEAQLRTKNLFQKFLNLAYKAADFPDCCLLLEDGLDCLSTRLEDKLNLCSTALNKPSNDQENVEPNVQQKDDLFSGAQLKKKEVKSKNSRMKKSFLDKLPKGIRSMPTKSAEPKKKKVKKQKPNDGVQPPKEVVNDDINKGTTVEVEEHNVIGNFIQLVSAPIYDDDILHVDDLL